MPRYEIVAHLSCALPGETAEEAAAQFRRRVLAAAGGPAAVLQLAVWRQEPAAAASPLPPALRQQLLEFFAGLERSAGEAEAAFRERVAAILATPGPAAEATSNRSSSGALDQTPSS